MRSALPFMNLDHESVVYDDAEMVGSRGLMHAHVHYIQDKPGPPDKTSETVRDLTSIY